MHALEKLFCTSNINLLFSCVFHELSEVFVGSSKLAPQLQLSPLWKRGRCDRWNKKRDFWDSLSAFASWLWVLRLREGGHGASFFDIWESQDFRGNDDSNELTVLSLQPHARAHTHPPESANLSWPRQLAAAVQDSPQPAFCFFFPSLPRPNSGLGRPILRS